MNYVFKHNLIHICLTPQKHISEVIDPFKLRTSNMKYITEAPKVI